MWACLLGQTERLYLQNVNISMIYQYGKVQIPGRSRKKGKHSRLAGVFYMQQGGGGGGGRNDAMTLCNLTVVDATRS